jgi:hypothetical protein
MTKARKRLKAAQICKAAKLSPKRTRQALAKVKTKVRKFL